MCLFCFVLLWEILGPTFNLCLLSVIVTVCTALLSFKGVPVGNIQFRLWNSQEVLFLRRTLCFRMVGISTWGKLGLRKFFVQWYWFWGLYKYMKIWIRFYLQSVLECNSQETLSIKCSALLCLHWIYDL